MSEMADLRAQVEQLRQAVSRRRAYESAYTDGNPIVSCRLPRPDRALLGAIADARGCSMAEIIREALAPVLHPDTGQMGKMGATHPNFVPRKRKAYTDTAIDMRDRHQAINASLSHRRALIQADAAVVQGRLGNAPPAVSVSGQPGAPVAKPTGRLRER